MSNDPSIKATLAKLWRIYDSVNEICNEIDRDEVCFPVRPGEYAGCHLILDDLDNVIYVLPDGAKPADMIALQVCRSLNDCEREYIGGSNAPNS